MDNRNTSTDFIQISLTPHARLCTCTRVCVYVVLCNFITCICGTTSTIKITSEKKNGIVPSPQGSLGLFTSVSLP